MKLEKTSYFGPLFSWEFLGALSLLVINDYYFKPNLNNWITGKLSDFAGLFVFLFVVGCLFRHRMKIVALVIGVLFVFWKSVYSQPLIDLFNHYSAMDAARVVDFSDNLALCVLPLGIWCFERVDDRHVPQWKTYPVLMLALFSIMGTSCIQYSPESSMFFQPVAQREHLPLSGDQLQKINGPLMQIAEGRRLNCLDCGISNLSNAFGNDRMTYKWKVDQATGRVDVQLYYQDPKEDAADTQSLQGEIKKELASVYARYVIFSNHRYIVFEKTGFNVRSGKYFSMTVPTPYARFHEFFKNKDAHRSSRWCEKYGLGEKIGENEDDRAVSVFLCPDDENLWRVFYTWNVKIEQYVNQSDGSIEDLKQQLMAYFQDDPSGKFNITGEE